MLRHRKRTISAEDDKIVEKIIDKKVTSTKDFTNPATTPTLEANKDIVLQATNRNFWKEEKETDTTTNSITIPLSEYFTKRHILDNYYTTEEVDEIIDEVIQLYGVKVITLNSINELPKQGDAEYANSSYIFFVKHTHIAGSDSNIDKDIYDEYVWDSRTKQYERIGNTDVDLSPYLKVVTFNNFVNNEYTPTIADIRGDITDLETNKVDKTTFNNTVNRLDTKIDGKPNMADVKLEIANELDAVLLAMYNGLSE